MRSSALTASILAISSMVVCGCAAAPAEPASPEGPAGGCVRDADCAPGQQCRDGLCRPYEAELGEPCYDDLDCVLGLACEGGVCVEPPDPPQ